MATHPIRILSIGIPGLPHGERSNFMSANVLQDYDAVIVNPNTIETLFGPPITYKNQKERILNDVTGDFLLRQSLKRRLEVHGLLEKGGVVIALMTPYKQYTFGNDYLTNYDWLLSRKEVSAELSISYGTGKTIENLAIHHPFHEYLKLKPSWSVYSDIHTATQYGWQILASAYGSHALSLAKQVKNGHIILIPDDYSPENGPILENCIQSILEIDVPSPKPDWVNDILVPGQEALYPKLNEINHSIEDLQSTANQINDGIEQLEKWKYLLYEKGEHHLRDMVRKALSIIDFQDKSDVEQIADGFFSCEYGDFILEVEGSKGSIKIEKISQLIKDRANYGKDKQTTSPKGILVGNPFREEPLDNRPPKDSNKSLFTKELIQTAEKQDIVVILSTDLYNVVHLFLRGQLPDERKQEIRKLIFESSGLLQLV